MSTVTEGGLGRLGKAQKEEGERRSAHHAVFVDGHNLRLVSNEYKSAGRVLRAHDRRRAHVRRGKRHETPRLDV